MHIKYYLFHHDDCILLKPLNVGAGLYSIFTHIRNFQMTAIATPSGGEQCNPRYQ